MPRMPAALYSQMRKHKQEQHRRTKHKQKQVKLHDHEKKKKPPHRSRIEDDTVFKLLNQLENKKNWAEGAEACKALEKNVRAAKAMVGPQPRDEMERLQEIVGETHIALFQLQLAQGEESAKRDILGLERAQLEHRQEETSAKIEELQAELTALEKDQEQELSRAELSVEKAEAELSKLQEQRDELFEAYREGRAKVRLRMKEWRREIASLDQEIFWMELEHQQEQVPPGPDMLRFVRAEWWHPLVFVTLLCNITFVLLEFAVGTNCLVCEMILTILFMGEIACVVTYYQGMHFIASSCGPVLWALVDLVIVAIGLILPLVSFGLDLEASSPFCVTVVYLLRTIMAAKLIQLSCIVDMSWVGAQSFQAALFVTVAANCFTLGLETVTQEYELLWRTVNSAFVLIYFFELKERWNRNRHSWSLFRGADLKALCWNYLDTLVLAINILYVWVLPLVIKVALLRGHDTLLEVLNASLYSLQCLRLLGALRLLELVDRIEPLHLLVVAMAKAMSSIGWVLLVTAGVLVASAVIGNKITHAEALTQGLTAQELEEVRKPFNRLSDSVFTLFKVMNGEMSDVDVGVMHIPLLKCMMMVFIVVTNWALFSILTAVFCDTMASVVVEHQVHSEHAANLADKLDKQEKLENLFCKVDRDCSGAINLMEFRSLLSDRGSMLEMCRITGLQDFDVEDLFDLISSEQHGGARTNKAQLITHEQFMHLLDIESGEATAQTITKIELHLAKIEGTLKPLGLCSATGEAKSNYALASPSIATTTGQPDEKAKPKWKLAPG